MGSVTAIGTAKGLESPSVSVAVDKFLAAPRNTASRNTQRAYAGILDRVAKELGVDRQLATITGEQIGAALTALWGDSSPSTWNQRRAAVGSWLSWCTDKMHWAAPTIPAVIERKREPARETQAVDWHAIERLCTRRDVQLRDKVLFRMLYETSSRASAILQLDIEDLDLQARSATIRQKGGDEIRVAWGDKTAMVLGRLIAGRTFGPVFLTDLKPGPRRAAAARTRDVDPETGRTRLSYGRARALIEGYTGGAITLHQLRHSSLTHLAEAGVGTTTLMAKSGHKNLRSLQRYARPSFAAVQSATELLADPPRVR